MRTKEDVIAYCSSLPGAYEDYPFKDTNWTLMRHSRGNRAFAFIFEREGRVWVNVKSDPEEKYYWLEHFASVQPAYHMNKKYWLSVILDGTLSDSELKSLLDASYALTKKK
ncbi:MAG: MmcQ/YjbR family DNA-binding protein [Acidaminococcaceae bacterium]|nr:MmcQ/YjbR family DNA-binding protein [Acidaminococcaceae bacterium]